MRDPLVLDGKSLAKATEAELSRRVEAIKQRNGDRTPILATILVGRSKDTVFFFTGRYNNLRHSTIQTFRCLL